MSVFPENENERIAYLKSFDILDSPNEKEFDSIVKLASKICGTPIALISLLDENRQWFKAKTGIAVESTDRNISFCQYAILDDKIFEVENALENSVFSQNPLVTDNPNIRYYAGAPLIDETGLNLGTLCVIDSKPNKLNDFQKEILKALAEEVVSLIKLRKKNLELEESKSEIESIFLGLQDGLVYQDVNGSIIKCNKSAEKILGLSYEQMIGKKSVDPSWRAIHEDGSDFPGDTHPSMVTLKTKKPLADIVMGVQKPNNELTWISINSVPIFDSPLKKKLKGVIATFKDITKQKIIRDNLIKLQQYDFISKIIAKTKDIIVITDNIGKIIWVNDAFEKLTEYSREEVIGKKPSSFLQGKNTDIETKNKIREAINNKEIIDINIVNYSKSKREYILNINLSPVFKDNSTTEVEYFLAIERDVTEIVLQQQNYNTALERWKFAVENTGDGIWDYDLVTNTSFQSDQFLKIIGYERGDLQINHEKMIELIHEEDRELVRQEFQQHLEGKIDRLDIEYRIKDKSGNYKWMYDRAKVIERSASGKPLRMVGVLQDFSERKKNELLKQIIINLSNKALSKKNFKEYYDKILTDILNITQSEYGFIGEVFLNENDEPYLKTYALTNISWDQATRDFYDQHAPDGLEFRNLNTLFGYALKHKEVVISNEPNVDDRRGGLPKGHPALNSFLGIPILFNNSLVGMLGVANKPGGYSEDDLSFLNPLISTFATIINSSKIEKERERNQHEIIQVKNELENFFDLTNDFMCIANIDGTFHKVNKEFERTLGYTKSFLEGKSFLDFVHQDDLPKTFQEIEKLAQGITTINFENRYRTFNGDYIILNWKSSPDKNNGMLYATARDVTKDKIFQEELILAKEKADEANKAKSAFLANMSHEIRTPLNGIIGFSELLNETKLNEDQKIFIDYVLQAGKSLLSIINDILDFSKIEAGKAELNIERLALHQLIFDLVQTVSYQAQVNEIDINVNIDSNIPENIYVDKKYLQQILLNLLGNAIKFTKQGEVNIYCSISKRIDSTCSVFKFCISDTGIGISPESINRIFESFSQADNTINREFGGTGLGLNIANNLVKLMGSDGLHVHSEVNKGSEFSFTLELNHDELILSSN